MTTKSILKKAADQSIIEPAQVEPLYQFIQAQQLTDQSNGLADEPLKFIRSFGDVFITLGIVLLVLAINLAELSGIYYLIPVVGFVLMAEWLVRVRRLALPGIAILISILFFVNKAVPFGEENTALFGFGLLSITSLLFYLRYKMPFSLLPLAAGLVAVSIVSIGINVLENPIVFVAFGLVVFAVALKFDSLDTKRVSYLSDNAFWLHLIASPLIVHGVMVSLFFSDQAMPVGIGKEIFMMLFFTGFFLLALLVDRRAMLISTQLYVIYALTQLLENRINTPQDALIYILIGLGFFVIYFGTYWYKTRRFVFGMFKDTKISHYVPDFNTQDVK